MLPGSTPIPPYKERGWKGYTYSELQYRRAYVCARLELEREQLVDDCRMQRQALSPSGLLGMAGSALKYANWGILAFQAFKTVGSIFGRRKK